MKVRESGMPDQGSWDGFFDAAAAIEAFQAGRVIENAAELGSGYGTFTAELARRACGMVSTWDIDAVMVEATQRRIQKERISNARVILRDFVADGTGLASQSQSDVLIFNLLHLEQPVDLLNEARRILLPSGRLWVMHWRSDIPTPRGPPLSIRPAPEACGQWLRDAGFRNIESIDLTKSCPFHFGLLAFRQ